MHSFTFDGINSREYCKLFVSGGGTFDAPERDIESIPVPGRNGELTIDHGRYKNIVVSYSGWIAENFDENARKARNWLSSRKGYKILRDDYHTGEFRKARFINGLQFSTIAGHVAGLTSVSFDCMPQRFLNIGLTPVSVIRGGTITNPTDYESLPLIKVVLARAGTASLNVGEKSVTIVGSSDESYPLTLILDADLQLAKTNTTPPVSKDYMIQGTIPAIAPGENIVTYTQGTITEVTITPNWWRL